jgi:hypothetical protein
LQRETSIKKEKISYDQVMDQIARRTHSSPALEINKLALAILVADDLRKLSTVAKPSTSPSNMGPKLSKKAMSQGAMSKRGHPERT